MWEENERKHEFPEAAERPAGMGCGVVSFGFAFRAAVARLRLALRTCGVWGKDPEGSPEGNILLCFSRRVCRGGPVVAVAFGASIFWVALPVSQASGICVEQLVFDPQLGCHNLLR